MEEKKLNIYQKLAAITEELGKVGKDLTVLNYKAVSEGNILAAVKPLENKYGVYSYPYDREIVESGFVEQEKIDPKSQQKYIAKNYFERIKVVYRFVNLDDPKDYIDIVSYGDGIDSGDKSVGKAMTYADKYALMKAYKIETGDDPDAKGSESYSKTATKKYTLDKDLKTHCDTLGIQLAKVAQFKGKNIVDLTNEDLQEAITKKEAWLEKHGKN